MLVGIRYVGRSSSTGSAESGGSGGGASGGGTSGGAGASGTSASPCSLGQDGTCATSTSYACCPMKGEHFYWDATAMCKTPLPTTSGTALCVATTYPAASGCGYFDEQTCLSRSSPEGLEVIVAAAYWKGSDAGPGWSLCDPALYQAVMHATCQ